MITIQINHHLDAEYQFVLELFARDFELDLRFVPNGAFSGIETASEGSSLSLSEDLSADLPVSPLLGQLFKSRAFSFRSVFKEEPIIRLTDGRPDYLSTCFYLINCLQEHGSSKSDQYGRFPFSESLQAHYNCAESDLVGQYFKALYDSIPLFATEGTPTGEASELFVSHDIDLLNHAWKEDGKHALKNGRPDKFAALSFRHVFKKPDWYNTTELLQLDRNHGFEPTFFWIPFHDTSPSGIPNADYVWDSVRVKNELTSLESNNAQFGLHKSVSNRTLSEELKAVGRSWSANRNHYLMIRLPQHWEAVEQAGLDIDASLGFSEHPGFRNCYARPFQPFNFEKRCRYRFLEVPLNLMDTTYLHYQQASPDHTLELLKEFLQTHKQGKVISLLWHNNAYSDGYYKEWRNIYDQILRFASELGYRGADQKSILQRYLIPEKT